MTDLLTADAMHFSWVINNDGIKAGCGFTWRRGEPAARFTNQKGDVTCPECVKTLKAAGMGRVNE